MSLFLAYLDQFRYMAGTLAMLWLLCHGVLMPRDRFVPRAILATAVSLALAFFYVPLEARLLPYLEESPFLIAPYWVLMSALLIVYVRFLYDTGLNSALFYVMISAFTENIVTTLIRNLLVYTFFPRLPETRPALYCLIMLSVYGVFYGCVHLVLRPRLMRTDGGWLSEDRGTTWLYLFLYAAYVAILSETKNLVENVIQPMAGYEQLADIYRYLQLFLSALLILLSIVMTTLLWHIHRGMAMRAENEVISRLARERQAQYEFSRENIEMINQKSHDLKHQLQALSQLSDEERRSQIQEASRAVDFYDAVVKTGNEALDTLLTEKSVYCANRGIRLSCRVKTENLRRIGLVDLYTLLGNALDNAIEGVERLEEPGQKTISLTILDRGSFLYFQLENYFDGAIRLQDGLPKTRKGDAQNHGFGIRSIRNIVRRYGGEMTIGAEGQIFCLEILIPT